MRVQYDEEEQEQPAQDEVPKKAAAAKEKDGGADFFGFGKSLTVKGSFARRLSKGSS